MQAELLSILINTAFLAKQPEEALVALAAKAKAVKYRKQAVIITEGEENASLYFVLSGRVKVFACDDKSRELTLLIQEAGSYFGELALFYATPIRSATVQALEQTVCAIISKADFIHWLNLHPSAATALLGVFAEKIGLLTEKVKQMALASTYERTISLLHELATREGDIYVIYHKPTDEELAKMVGTQRETINKFMNGLIEGGYVSKKGKTLRIEKKLPAKF